MSDIRFVSAFALIGVGLLSNSSAYALGLDRIDWPPLDKNHLHTSTPSTEPAPLFAQLDKAYKTAGVCFLGIGDCAPSAGFDSSSGSGGGDDEDFDINTSNQCLNEGFTPQSCNSVQTIDGVCPYNSAYGRGCKCKSGLISCPAGQVGEGDSCNGMYASCKCDPNLIACSDKEIGQGAECGGKYESCVCKAEYQYDAYNCTYPQSTSGDECGGKYTECICPEGVDEGEFGCEEYYPYPCDSICKIAYSDNCHIRSDNTGTYGCEKVWDDCDTKCEIPKTDNCDNRTAVLPECYTGFNCQYFDDCPSKVSSWTCALGYIGSGAGCVSCSSIPSVTVPANATCTDPISECAKCSAWTCNSGYIQSGNSCVTPCDTVTAVISSCPYNAICTYYPECSSKIKSWICDIGYEKSGYSCIKSRPSVDCDSECSFIYGSGSCFSACKMKCQSLGYAPSNIMIGGRYCAQR